MNNSDGGPLLLLVLPTIQFLTLTLSVANLFFLSLVILQRERQ